MTQLDTSTTLTTTQRWVLAVTAVAGLLVTLDALVVTTALSAIRASLHTSVEQLEWTVTAYALAFAVLLMTATVLGDRFGRRRVFAAGLALFAVSSAGCALAPGIGVLVAARALQGAGAAMVMPLALTLLAASIPPHRRSMALGVFASVAGLAVPLGPLLGGAVVTGVSWRWIFWINVPIAAVLIVLTYARIGESAGPTARLDVRSLLLATAAALGVVWALVRGNTAGWGSAEVLATLVLGVLCAAGFVRRQRRAAEPLLPRSLFGSRGFAAGNVAIFLLWGSTLGALFFMAQFLQIGLGYGPLRAGLALMPWGAMTVIVPQLVGRFIGRFGQRPFVVAGAILHGVSMAWIAALAQPGPAYWQLVAPLVLSGIGVAMVMPATQSAVLGSITPHLAGRASGAYSTMRQLGGAFGVALVVAAFAAAGDYRSDTAFSRGFAAALVACAALGLAAVLAGAAIPGRVRTAPAQPTAAMPARTAERTRRTRRHHPSEGADMLDSTRIDGSVALVTGANRGIGLAITEALLERGATKVYATARDPRTLEDLRDRYGSRLIALRMDVTDAGQVADAARRATDVGLLVNNAGAFEPTELTDDAIVEVARREMEVNYFGVLRVLQSFAEVLVRRGGVVVNIGSAAGLSNIPLQPTYSASKAAQHSLTQAARAVLGVRGVRVHGVYAGPVDTAMTRDLPPQFEKTAPVLVAKAILDGVEAGDEDIVPDPFSAGFGAQFHASPKEVERQMAALVAAGEQA